jgi:hypothetical protein
MIRQNKSWGRRRQILLQAQDGTQNFVIEKESIWRFAK